MKNDEDVKLLGRIFLIVFIIIFLIIVIALVNNIFSVNKHKYELPTTTTKYIDYSFVKMSEVQKNEYNTMFNENKYLYALNNAVGSILDYTKINLLQGEESKFKFAYTYNYLETSNENMDFTTIDNYVSKYFNTNIYEYNFIKYKVDNYYKYTIDNNLKFCIKADKIKSVKNELIIQGVLIEYEESKCNESIVNESDIINQVEITYLVIDHTKYLQSFIIID